MALIMLLAIIFRSLPDSVFNFFHTHSHVNTLELKEEAGYSIEDYQHNCQIEDWNYESFEVTENNFQPALSTSANQLCLDNQALFIYISVSPIGRAPPVA